MARLTLIDLRPKELAHRSVNGINVTLQWTPGSETLSVLVDDLRTGQAFELVLDDSDDPMEVFEHPYVYAAWRGVEYQLPELRAA